MPNARDLVEVPRLKVLLVSPPGWGKSTMASTARIFGPMYVFDFDLQIETFAGMDVDYDQYPESNPKSFERAWDKLKQLEKANPYSVVVCDGLTYLGKCAMRAAMPLTKAFMPRMTRLGNGEIEVPGGTDGADYNTQMTLIEEFLAKLRGLNCHVICTAHEQIEKDDNGNVLEVVIAITGKLAGRVPGKFNEFYRMVVRQQADSSGQPKPLFLVQTVPDKLRGARTKYGAGKLIDVMRNGKLERVTITSGLSAFEQPDFGLLYPKMVAHAKEVAAATQSATLVQPAQGAA